MIIALPPRVPAAVWRDARALANISVIELAQAAGATSRTIGRLEADAAITIAPKRRHGHVSRTVFDKIIAALAERGVELVEEGEGHGAGVRWVKPRSRRT
jgi:hypothetical protein